MHYRESTSIDRSSWRGYTDGPGHMLFGSHEIGQIKAFFSNFERYNDSDVSVSVNPGYYDVSITVHSNLNKGDGWCRGKLYDALRFVADHIARNCRQGSGSLSITIELYTA